MRYRPKLRLSRPISVEGVCTIEWLTPKLAHARDGHETHSLRTVPEYGKGFTLKSAFAGASAILLRCGLPQPLGTRTGDTPQIWQDASILIHAIEWRVHRPAYSIKSMNLDSNFRTSLRV